MADDVVRLVGERATEDTTGLDVDGRAVSDGRSVRRDCIPRRCGH